MKNYSVLLTYKKKRLFGSIEKNISIKTKAQTHEEAKINALKDAQESMKGFTLIYCEIQFDDDDYNPLNDLAEMFPLAAKQQLKRED